MVINGIRSVSFYSLGCIKPGIFLQKHTQIILRNCLFWALNARGVFASFQNTPRKCILWMCFLCVCVCIKPINLTRESATSCVYKEGIDIVHVWEAWPFLFIPPSAVLQGVTVSLDVTPHWKRLCGLLLLLGVGRLFFVFLSWGLHGVPAHLAPVLLWKLGKGRGEQFCTIYCRMKLSEAHVFKRNLNSSAAHPNIFNFSI